MREMMFEWIKRASDDIARIDQPAKKVELLAKLAYSASRAGLTEVVGRVMQDAEGIAATDPDAGARAKSWFELVRTGTWVKATGLQRLVGIALHEIDASSDPTVRRFLNPLARYVDDDSSPRAGWTEEQLVTRAIGRATRTVERGNRDIAAEARRIRAAIAALPRSAATLLRNQLVDLLVLADLVDEAVSLANEIGGTVHAGPIDAARWRTGRMADYRASIAVRTEQALKFRDHSVGISLASIAKQQELLGDDAGLVTTRETLERITRDARLEPWQHAALHKYATEVALLCNDPIAARRHAVEASKAAFAQESVVDEPLYLRETAWTCVDECYVKIGDFDAAIASYSRRHPWIPRPYLAGAGRWKELGAAHANCAGPEDAAEYGLEVIKHLAERVQSN